MRFFRKQNTCRAGLATELSMNTRDFGETRPYARGNSFLEIALFTVVVVMFGGFEGFFHEFGNVGRAIAYGNIGAME
jgi:hypothetical protein